MDILQVLQQVDENLFLAINRDGNVPVLNPVMLLFRNAVTWIPLYLFVLLWSFFKFKERFIPFVVLSIITFAVSDFTSASILKPAFLRPRPCYNPALIDVMNLLTGCGGVNSMPSSHATNHFALATFWFWSIYITTGKKWRWLWLWAAVICYAQVYVGKHYPFDVLVGAFYGLVIGTVAAKIFEKPTLPFRKNNNTFIQTNTTT